jgi:EAL domain-containing protein (putative c-di-GMP-specific phosphodiesterase class I)
MWILRQAAAQLKRWHAQYPCDPPLSVSVNLSPRQFEEPHLVDDIAQVLRETALEPSSLRLEITESLLLENHDQARDVLVRLKQLGIGLKLDDFGTGYSSLAYLAQLPFDTMKIDQAFMLQLRAGDANSEIVASILDMAHTLGMRVVAEGVERNDQVTRLISMGCEYGQGYFFSRPVSVEDAERLITEMRAPVLSATVPAVYLPEPPFTGTPFTGTPLQIR